MKRFHFSVGNSTDGPVGFCAAVYAETPEEAVELLRNALPVESPVRPEDRTGISYIAAYFNQSAVTVADIDEVEDT